MRIVFCADPLQPRRVDEAYQAKFDAARQLSLATALISFAVIQGAQERGVALTNSPEAYAFSHHLPLSYGIIAPHTPQTISIPIEGFSIANLPELLQPFGDHPIIVKDYVKSRKHEWAEACFIPSAQRTSAEARKRLKAERYCGITQELSSGSCRRAIDSSRYLYN